MKLKKGLFILAIGVGFLINTRSIMATDTAAVEKMPIGVSNLTDIFTIPTLSSIQSGGGTTAITNSSKMINSTNASSIGTQGVQVTDALSQVGAVWSNADAKVDLSKNWMASMWMYFGNQGTSAADGMAFVLQNVGTTAITGKMDGPHR